jgi:hypothetical protein
MLPEGESNLAAGCASRAPHRSSLQFVRCLQWENTELCSPVACDSPETRRAAATIVTALARRAVESLRLWAENFSNHRPIITSTPLSV